VRRQLPPHLAVHDYEPPVMRNDRRSNSNFIVDNNAPHRGSIIQVQLQRLSMHSSSSQQLPPNVVRQRLPMISRDVDSGRLEAQNELSSVRSATAADIVDVNNQPTSG